MVETTKILMVFALVSGYAILFFFPAVVLMGMLKMQTDLEKYNSTNQNLKMILSSTLHKLVAFGHKNKCYIYQIITVPFCLFCFSVHKCRHSSKKNIFSVLANKASHWKMHRLNRETSEF